MRIMFNLSGINELVPFNYLPLLVGRLHKWLGQNDLHDATSLYSLSWLTGGKAKKGGISFLQGGQFFVSFYNEEIGRKLINAALTDRNIFHGLEVESFHVQQPPVPLGERVCYFAASPILVKLRNPETNNYNHIDFKHEKAGEILTATLHRKLKLAGLKEEGKIYFDPSYTKAKTKLIMYKEIKNRGNLCPVIVEAPEQVQKFVWLTGVGHSTGSGFGAVK